MFLLNINPPVFISFYKKIVAKSSDIVPKYMLFTYPLNVKQVNVGCAAKTWILFLLRVFRSSILSLRSRE